MKRVKSMLSLNLPGEVEKSKFPEFLDKAKEKFPVGELLVQYVEIKSKVIILGVGKSGDCAQQTVQALKTNPALKQLDLKLEMLRAPESGYLLSSTLLK